MKGSEWRTSLFEGGQIFSVIIGCASLPAAEEDTDPLESQAAKDDLVAFALLGVVGDIILRPLAFGQRKSGKLVEGLPVEFGASPTSVNDLGAPTLFGNGGDARKALHVGSGGIVRAIGSEEGGQARSHGPASARQLGKEIGLRIIVKDLFNALLIILDGAVEALNEFGMPLA